MGEKTKILIVDDDDALLFAFNKIFQHSDYSIDTADSVGKAKKRVSGTDYVLVITDLRFAQNEPENGYDLIQFVKENSPTTKTILLTAFVTQELEKEEEAKAKPDLRLKKPIKSETIKGIMRKMGIFKGDSEGSAKGSAE